MRYDFPLSNLPKYCACGILNTVDHSLICKRGGFVSLRHNKIRDLEASFLSEVCKDVTTEPPLLPLSGETFDHRTANRSDEARLDISARGVWSSMDKAFFDIRIFHPGAESNKHLTPENMYAKHENEKKRAYNARVIDVEKASFTPLVFSTSGGMGVEANKLNKRLASLIAIKRDILYSDAVSFIRKRLRFTILKTTLIALRGFKGKQYPHGTPKEFADIDINILPQEKPFS